MKKPLIFYLHFILAIALVFAADVPFISQGHAETASCKISLKPKVGSSIRSELARVSNSHGVFVCPFEDGAPVTIYQVECRNPPIDGLGATKSEQIRRIDFAEQIAACSPALAVIDRRKQSLPSENSFIVKYRKEKFDAGILSKPTHDEEKRLKQAIIGTGAPVYYFDSISTDICIKFTKHSDWDINRLLRESGENINANFSVSKVSGDCQKYFRDNYDVSLRVPLE